MNIFQTGVLSPPQRLLATQRTFLPHNEIVQYNRQYFSVAGVAVLFTGRTVVKKLNKNFNFKLRKVVKIILNLKLQMSSSMVN